MNTLDRIATLARNAREAADQMRAAYEQRDAAIVEAVDELGISQRQVAEAAGLAKSGIVRILGNADVHAVL